VKRFLPAIFFFVLLLGSPLPILASGFQLKTVGVMDVDGVTYDHLWYTGGNVTFTGIALADASVTATIDGTGSSVTADSSGNWSYSTSLAAGDHTVSFTSNESTISFTLTIGEVPAGVGGLPTATTPTAGTITPTLLVIGSGLTLFFLPLFLRRVLI
jgi:hypothetical protein